MNERTVHHINSGGHKVPVPLICLYTSNFRSPPTSNCLLKCLWIVTLCTSFVLESTVLLYIVHPDWIYSPPDPSELFCLGTSYSPSIDLTPIVSTDTFTDSILLTPWKHLDFLLVPPTLYLQFLLLLLLFRLHPRSLRYDPDSLVQVDKNLCRGTVARRRKCECNTMRQKGQPDNSGGPVPGSENMKIGSTEYLLSSIICVG